MGVSARGGCSGVMSRQTPPPTQTPPALKIATAAVRTHPNGMHSCFYDDFILLASLFVDLSKSWLTSI